MRRLGDFNALLAAYSKHHDGESPVQQLFLVGEGSKYDVSELDWLLQSSIQQTALLRCKGCATTVLRYSVQ